MNHLIGTALSLLDKNKDALQMLNRAVELDPRNVNFILNKADCLFKLEKHKEALNTFDDLIKLEPKMSRAYASKGNIFVFRS